MARHLGGLRIFTQNINCITSLPKVLALKACVQRGAYDVILLQEVNAPVLSDLPGYEAIFNIDRDHLCGTALLYRRALEATDIQLLPTGRAIACVIRGVQFVNVYAPSGGNRWRERTSFYQHDIIPFLTTTRPIVFGGDFNCVLSPADQHPRPTISAELRQILTSKDLYDVWRHFHPVYTEYTHFYNNGASRIDRIYVSSNLTTQLLNITVLPVAFSDHSGVVCELNLPGRVEPSPPRVWKLNVSHLTSDSLRTEVSNAWDYCLEKANNYSSILQWWTRLAKPQLRRAVQRYCREEAYWRRSTLDFYQQCLIDATHAPVGPDENMRMRLNRIKSRVLRFLQQRAQGALVRSRCPSSLEGEDPTLYHLTQEQRRAKANQVKILVTDTGDHLTADRDIVSYLYDYYHNLFQPVAENLRATQEILRTVENHLTDADREDLVAPLQKRDVETALKRSPKGKSPGLDGLPAEFYCAYWDILGNALTGMVNEVLRGEPIPPELLVGRVTLIPKVQGQCRAQDLRPITLLNADYKLLARCVAEKMKVVLDDVVSPYQSCGVRRRNIFNAAAAYRDVVARVAVTGQSAGIVSIDFANAFDRIGHGYLLSVMDRMGFGQRFLRVVRNLLTGATSVITVNGCSTHPISISRSVRQGCPMSMFYFVIAIDPLLRSLGNNLRGVRIGTTFVRCAAYADDVGVYVTSEHEIDTTRAVIRLYEHASGAQINHLKTVLIPIGEDGIDVPRTWYRVVDDQKILGIEVTNCPKQMQTRTWKRVKDSIRGLCQCHTDRRLDIIQRTKLINLYILSRAWYVAQLFPVPKLVANSISKVTFWLLWRHAIFKVKSVTCARNPAMGGLGLVDFYHKCTALLIHRTAALQATHPQGSTAALLRRYRRRSEVAPISLKGIPFKMPHIREYYFHRSYVLETAKDQHCTTRLLYEKLQGRPPAHRMEARHPAVNWKQVWANISSPFLPSGVRGLWYRLVNDVLQTNQRLAAIRLHPTGNCTTCQVLDTREHRLTCQQVSAAWDLCRGMIALINGTTPASVTVDWFTMPQLKPSPRTRHNATVWLLGHVAFAILELRHGDGVDFMAYLSDAHRQAKLMRRYNELFGSFLMAALVHGYQKVLQE